MGVQVPVHIAQGRDSVQHRSGKRNLHKATEREKQKDSVGAAEADGKGAKPSLEMQSNSPISSSPQVVWVPPTSEGDPHKPEGRFNICGQDKLSYGAQNSRPDCRIKNWTWQSRTTKELGRLARRRGRHLSLQKRIPGVYVGFSERNNAEARG